MVDALLNLARFYRQVGLYDVAILFALRASYVGEDKMKVDAEIATSGWHSKRSRIRNMGSRICEELALSREFPEAAREVAWRNLFWYRKQLKDMAPSVFRKRINFDPPSGFYPTNPSIVNGPHGMVMNVRCVNYRIGIKNPGPTITRNFLFDVDPSLEWGMLGELELPAESAVAALESLAFDETVIGLEDLRLWNMYDRLWASGTIRKGRFCEICAVSIDGIKVRQFIVLDPHKIPKRHQKNWMPIADWTSRFRFIYSCDPITIVGCKIGFYYSDPNALFLQEIGTPPISARFWRGSSQAIPFDDGFLAIVHECPKHLDPVLHKPPYQQRFVWFDRDFQIRKLSWGWEFGHNSNGEYVCGMCEHPDGERLVISYGVLDREAWLATVLKDEVRAILRDA